MRFRKLRIAWSVTWGVVAVLLIVLWVRSYWWEESVHYDGQTHYIFALTNWGIVRVGVTDPNPFGDNDGSWIFRRNSADAENASVFDWGSGWLTLPYWFILALTASLAAAPWIRLRFSLRTLLIATTVVAIVLGLIVAVI
jgi:hypothetical protein